HADQVGLVSFVAPAERQKSRVHLLWRLADSFILDEERVFDWASFPEEADSDLRCEFSGVRVRLLSANRLLPTRQFLQWWQLEIRPTGVPRRARWQRVGVLQQLQLTLALDQRLHRVDGTFGDWVLGIAGKLDATGVSAIPPHREPVQPSLLPPLLRSLLVEGV